MEINAMRVIPNPQSRMLANAVVGGSGLGIPPDSTPPAGMAVVVLYVPIEQMVGKNPVDIQRDLGLPWYAEGGPAVWFDEMGIS